MPILGQALPSLLVGRDCEQRILRDRPTNMLAGRSGLVLIGGEAGISKTALAEAFCRSAARGALVLAGQCYDLTETPPYGPWMELFRRCWHADEFPPLPVAFSARRTVGAVASQAALFHEMLDFYTEAAANRPLVVLLNDFHWADLASLDVLRSLVRALSALPLLLIATYRSEELTRRHPLYDLFPLLVREAAAERLDLNRLPQSALRTLVETRYTVAEQDAQRLVSYLHGRAEGNALFTTELLRTLEEEEALFLDVEGWHTGNLHRITVPIFLRQVINGRVRRLGKKRSSCSRWRQ